MARWPIGAATAVQTLVSGPLYAGLGSYCFLAMVDLCAVAVPFERGLPRAREG